MRIADFIGRDCATTRTVTEPATPFPTRQILGVRFFAGSPTEAVALALTGGLVVVPSAPVMVNATEEPATLAALQASDLALTDSGLMVLFWNITRRDHLRRLSGLEYLILLLREPDLRRPGAVLWVMPNAASAERNRAWLATQGFPVTAGDFYLAPLYPAGFLQDEKLLALASERRPAHIITAIGGCVQERLGHYLQQNLPYRPAIHCIGAAIGFLNGDQVNIPAWADRYFLGWLFRCFQSPARFVPRYWNARALVSILWRYGEKTPVAEAR